MSTASLQKSIQQLRLGFLGAGSITEAMLTGICKQNLLDPDHIFVTNHGDDERLEFLQQRFGVHPTRDKKAMLESCDTLILAMKPKDAREACIALRGIIRRDQLIISLIAGIPTDLIATWLNVDCPIIRTMPNTSSAIGLSATGISAGRFAEQKHMDVAYHLFTSIGTVFPLPESELDIVTGLSGSGPAYVYYLVEAMELAGQKAGLSAEMSRQLTVQTLLGAAHMLQHTQTEPAVLRKKVTSPGGTTQAGIEVLEAYRFQEAVTAAILRATQRARELGAQHENTSIS